MDLLNSVLNVVFLVLFLFGFGSDANLLQDSLTLFTRSNSGIRVVEECSELVEFLKRGMIGTEVDIEANAEGHSYHKANETSNGLS